ncbi:MAG: class I SAM-dependent methyltransferase [Clostridiaceae bacterium]|nr:class I SAM-dependent methyltransferase [Clostridiaceae bacterium]
MDEFLEQYSALSAFYDRLTFDVDYNEYAKGVDMFFKKHGIPGNLVLELACGTGSLSIELGKLGYEMISCDISPDMLSSAREKCSELNCPPVFICQDMCELDLYGTVDGCVCAIDSVNYLTELWQLKAAFKRIALFMNKGGLFIFDVKSISMFKELDGISSVWDDDDMFAAWQYGYDKKSMRAMHIVDVFVRTEGLYKRFEETHYQRAYKADKLKEVLKQSGFEIIGIYRDIFGAKAHAETGRLFFVAVKN